MRCASPTLRATPSTSRSPPSVASSRDEIVSADSPETLSERPLALEFKAQPLITYYVRRDVPAEELNVRTVLLRRPGPGDAQPQSPRGLTGLVTSFVSGVDWRISIAVSAALLLLLIVARAGGFGRKLKFLAYEESGKQGLHALRTVVNDGLAQLEGGSIDQATLRYKEARLAYERLPVFAQNEGYDDLLRLHSALDLAYFNGLALRIRDAIERQDLGAALDDFERLEGTFGTLPSEQQQELVAIVNEIARRLGAGGAA